MEQMTEHFCKADAAAVIYSLPQSSSCLIISETETDSIESFIIGSPHLVLLGLELCSHFIIRLFTLYRIHVSMNVTCADKSCCVYAYNV